MRGVWWWATELVPLPRSVALALIAVTTVQALGWLAEFLAWLL